MIQGSMKENQRLCDDYRNNVKPYGVKARRVCVKWTNTSCQAASEILPMLEKYSRLRAIDKGFVQEKIPPNLVDDYNDLEAYRVAGISFFSHYARSQTHMTNTEYPSTNEAVEFSTFHWAIYMTNNKCAELPGKEGKQPYTYDWIKKSLQADNVTEKYVDAYQLEVMDAFPGMQSKALKKKGSWWLWKRTL
jgi:hypothetical protein